MKMGMCIIIIYYFTELQYNNMNAANLARNWKYNSEGLPDTSSGSRELTN